MDEHFTADDGTEMTFKMVKELDGCQQFKIIIKGRAAPILLAFGGLNTEVNYNQLKVLFADGQSKIRYLDKLTTT